MNVVVDAQLASEPEKRADLLAVKAGTACDMYRSLFEKLSGQAVLAHILMADT